ncbi:MAG: bifunctional UDP-N-acetylglucosamine diphosphorylase/glucosamine-1-phosphate N-acetyltransferase GlmU [Solirubrobacteraceae bacterium]
MAAQVVVILAAGQGTRMRSGTPKLLHQICGLPMIAWPVAAARDAGASRVVVVDNPDRRLEAVLDPDVTVAVQKTPRGTADAARAGAADFAPGNTVVVLNGDAPLISGEAIRSLVEAHTRAVAAATIGTVILDDPSGYGRVVRDADGMVQRVVETKAPGDASDAELQIREVNTGLFAFDGDALLAALDQVDPQNAQGELYLPDVLPALRAQGRTVIGHALADPSEMLGINDRVALADVTAVAQRRIHERHMLAGVTIVNPAATVIDAGVEIGRDTVIAPFSSLHGATRIDEGATVGPLSTLIDASVGRGANVVHSYVRGAVVGDRVSVGPFAFLRPGTILREGAKAGAFVEIKNSDIGAGAKVPHLSYIGDTDIGERTNIGAGTITANYDGKNKSRTTIGAGAFVSVDTMFVAPVNLGDGAYTAAGSVITNDVPPGALGVARARQRNIDGYGDRRKERDAAEHDASGGANNVPASPETEPSASKSSAGEPPAT